MVDVKSAAQQLAKLSLLKFFPNAEEARAALVQMVCEMAENNRQIDWLVSRVLGLYNEWPGPHEVRATFCSKFAPQDGINAYSAVYLDGIPSERPSSQIAASPVKLLEGGRSEVLIDSPKIAAAISAAAKKMPKMPSARPVGADRFTERLAEVATAPQDRTQLPDPTPQTITPEQIAQAARELQERRARGERMPWE